MLNFLDKITINNQLKGLISEVVVQYAESNKSLNNWYNLRDVNVETFENIAWSRCVTFNDDIAPNTEVEITADNICFGENNGFWQVYFIYENKNYKLFKPNCEFTLVQDDNNGKMEITFLLDQNEEDVINILFQKGTTSKFFSIVEGTIMKRGINISLKNETSGTIDDISVFLIETFSMSSPKKTSQNKNNENFSTNNRVKFNDYKIEKEGFTTSKEPVSFTYHKHSQYWQVKFTYNNYFYEIQTKSESGVNFNLDTKHHGSELTLSIFEISKTSEIGIRFEIDTCNKTFPCKKLRSIDEQIEKIKNISNEFNCPKLFQKFSLAIHKFTHALRTLSRIGYKNFTKEKIFTSDGSHLFYPTLKPEIQSVELMLERSKITVGTFLLVIEKEDGDIVLSAIKNINFYLDSIKEIWLEIMEISQRLKSLMKNFENRKHGEESSVNIFLRSIFHNLELFDSMQITLILCELLDLVAINEIGLSFKISNSEQMHDVSAEVGVLALTLEDELKVWNQKEATSYENNENLKEIPNGQVIIHDKENKYDDSANNFNVPGNAEEHLTSIQIQLIYESSLIKSAGLFQMVREKLIDCLHDISTAIHLTNRNISISMITSSAVGLFGAGLVITGLALTPFTAGISSGLVAAGVGVGASGGVLGVGTSITDSVLTQNHLKSTLDLALIDRKVSKSLACLQDITTKNKLSNDLNNGGSFCVGGSNSATLHHPQYETKVVGECAANALSNFGVVAVKTGVQVAKNSVLRFGSVTVGVLFDVTSLAFRAVNLSKGGKSELGYKMEVESQDLEKELEEVLNVIEQMGIRVVRRNQRGSDSSNESSMPIIKPVLELI